MRMNMYGLGMLLIWYLKWFLLAVGGVCLWVALGPLTALGAECIALAVIWELSVRQF